MTTRKRTLVTGVIGADTHIVGNRILGMVLEKAGYKVVSLGALTPAEEFVEAAIETAADGIMVSSLYGQGELDCRDFATCASKPGSTTFCSTSAAIWSWASSRGRTSNVDSSKWGSIGPFRPAFTPTWSSRHCERTSKHASEVSDWRTGEPDSTATWPHSTRCTASVIGERTQVARPAAKSMRIRRS